MMRSARAIGLVCGLVAVALAVHSWAIASTGAALGTDVGVVAVAPGELELSAGPVLQATGMQPGGAPATGTVLVRNITAVPVRVRIRALPSTRALDDVLELDARAGGRTIAAGRAGELRSWSSRRFVIGVRDRATLRIGARLRGPAQGLIADVALELDAEPLVARR